MWVLAVVLNGLLFVSYEPFGSDEACHLAANLAKVERFECIEVPVPELPEEEPVEPPE